MTQLISKGSKLWQCITSNCLKHHLWGLWIKFPLCTVYISCGASLKMTILHNMCIPLSFNYAKPTWLVVRFLVHVATHATVNYIPDSHGRLIFHGMIQRVLIGIQWSAKIGLLECEIYIHPLSVSSIISLGKPCWQIGMKSTLFMNRLTPELQIHYYLCRLSSFRVIASIRTSMAQSFISSWMGHEKDQHVSRGVFGIPDQHLVCITFEFWTTSTFQFLSLWCRGNKWHTTCSLTVKIWSAKEMEKS